jgi:predicted esterase
MKKLLLSLMFSALSFSALEANVTQDQCNKKGENYIFAGGECIQYAKYKAEDKESLNIIVHGTWDSGTNTLGRYAPFAESLYMYTDITTVAVALPGYSDSSTNTLEDLKHEGSSVYSKDYIAFTASLIKALKEKFNATKVNYIGHSAGASLGVNVVAMNPGLLNSVTAAGGRYDLNKFKENERANLVTISEHLDSVKDTKILLVYGTKDTISEPAVTTNFYELAKSKGIDLKIVKVEGAAHIDLDMTDPSVEAITELVTE